jgi:glycosyltransferase involved in cell wall biosynthesis
MTLDKMFENPSSLHIMVCIPAYNEEKNISQVIQNSKKFAKEVIVYDDGSTDETSKVATECGAIVIRNPKNKGYGKALSELFRYSLQRNVDIMLTLDSDGQHDPDQIPSLIEPILKNEADVVLGSRFLKREITKSIPSYRSLGIRAITKVARVASYDNITDSQSGFRAYNNNALSKLRLYEDGMAISTEILLKAKDQDLKVTEVPITIKYFQDSSTHNPVSHGISVMTHLLRHLSFRKPLIFYGLPGLFFLIISSVFMYSALDQFSTTRYVSTNMIILSLGFALMGMMLLATSAIIFTMLTLFKERIKDL